MPSSRNLNLVKLSLESLLICLSLKTLKFWLSFLILNQSQYLYLKCCNFVPIVSIKYRYIQTVWKFVSINRLKSSSFPTHALWSLNNYITFISIYYTIESVTGVSMGKLIKKNASNNIKKLWRHEQLPSTSF